MKRITAITMISSVLALSGCSSLKSVDATIKVESSSQVQITNVIVHEEGGQLHVMASLRPTSGAVRSTGHVDISFIGTDEQLIQNVKARPNVSQFSRSSSRTPMVSEFIDLTAGEVTAIYLTHHADLSNECEGE